MFTMIEKQTDEKITVFLDGELDIFTIESVIEKIDTITDSYCDVDLGAVTFIDSSGIGLLIRKIMDWKDDGRLLTISNIQSAVHEVMEEMGAFIILEEVYCQ